ncbi:hypothetical protein K431DRAFT_283283 [Polychaeton citri CBS 116435]|uniref:Uncharacterized protein n=1 Tax=Polychaeton citri CBS 116435 TaxID=1314669 RepID=A0A9P4UP64_9PEZI|nr:hypothetical protein K431DRAFT_283283 [Polychaeton citri CBS 116435]
MGIAGDRPSLPDRILGSARGLLDSAFSSVGGIEPDLQSLRNVGSKGHTTHRRLSGCSATAQRPKKSGIAKKQRLLGSFRGDGMSTAASRRLEDEFRDFTSTKPLTLLTESLEGDAGHPDVRGEVRTSPNNVHDRDQSWRMEIERDNVLSPMSTFPEGIEQGMAMDLSGLVIGDFKSSHHITAARRIALVGDQLGRVSILQWQASEQARMLSGKVQPHQRDNQHVASLDHAERLASHRHVPSVAQALHATHHCEDVADEEDPVHEFHCPYVGCCENFELQSVNVSSEQQQRGCVHGGCAFISETMHGWLEHIMSPHHDLQDGMHPEAGNESNESEA